MIVKSNIQLLKFKDTEHFQNKKIIIASELIKTVSEECNFKRFQSFERI